MLLQKTEKARLELSPGVRTLSLRERSLLLLADGKSLSALQAMYHGIGAQMVDQLIRQGYLTRPTALHCNGAADATPGTSPRAAVVHHPAPEESSRSLAGARMYLFDTCERLFSRRNPGLAQHFREALRAARDRGSMLAVGDAVLHEVARTAGAERAATLRERLQSMLPTIAGAAEEEPESAIRGTW